MGRARRVARASNPERRTIKSMKGRNERFEAWAKAHRFAFSLAAIPVVVAIMLLALGLVELTSGRSHNFGPTWRDLRACSIGAWIGIMLGYHGRWIISDIRTRRESRTGS